MKKNVIRVLVGIYIVIAVLTTFSLLTYNNLHISEFNKKSFRTNLIKKEFQGNTYYNIKLDLTKKQ